MKLRQKYHFFNMILCLSVSLRFEPFRMQLARFVPAQRPYDLGQTPFRLDLSVPVGPDLGSDNISMDRLHYVDRRKTESPACGPTNHPDGIARRLYTWSLSSCGTNEASNLDVPLCGKGSQWNDQSRHQIGRLKILSTDFGNLSLCEFARGAG